MAKNVPTAAPTTTALQRHVKYFDTDNNGTVTPTETVNGLQRLGLGWVNAQVKAFVIHAALGPKTNGKSMFVPFNGSDNVDVAKIEQAMHRKEGDSGVFTTKGEVNEKALNEFLKTYDKNGTGSLSESEIKSMIQERAKNLFGKVAMNGEWNLLKDIGADTTETIEGSNKKEKALSFERIRSLFNGTAFPTIESEVAARKAKK